MGTGKAHAARLLFFVFLLRRFFDCFSHPSFSLFLPFQIHSKRLTTGKEARLQAHAG